MYSIKVSGISGIGTVQEMQYTVFGHHDFEAIERALGYARDDFTCKYDKNKNPIPNTDYKAFVNITKIEIIND